MIRETPFHPRTSEANQTGLWSHWAGYLAADRYQMSEKFEYFAIRNSVAVIDTSPLHKYRIAGVDAERYLAGVLTRDIRKCRPGQAQYTLWCDDDGFVLEDGVILRLSETEFQLSAARPNQAYLEDLATGLRVKIEDVTDDYGALAVQGPHARDVLGHLAPDVEALGYFRLTPAKIGGTPVTISRTGYTGDLGYEIWVERAEALTVWDALFEVAAPRGAIPVGQTAMLIARIEAGLLLIDVDFHSARYAWNDDRRVTPIELGMSWMIGDLADDDRAFIGRHAIERETTEGNPRWRTVGIMVDWEDWNRVYGSHGLVPPKDHTPEHGGMMIYDQDADQIGWASSFVYSPLLQRHIAIGRLRPERAKPGNRVTLELTIDHRHEMVGAQVSRLPFFNPSRKTA